MPTIVKSNRKAKKKVDPKVGAHVFNHKGHGVIVRVEPVAGGEQRFSVESFGDAEGGKIASVSTKGHILARNVTIQRAGANVVELHHLPKHHDANHKPISIHEIAKRNEAEKTATTDAPKTN